MIRINLLQGPRGRKARGQWDVRAELALAGTLVAVTIVGCVFYSISLASDISSAKTEVQNKERELNKLKQEAQQVDKFEAKKKQLEKHNRLIESLEKRRTGPLKIMDVVSRSLEPQKVWLISMILKPKNLKLQGRALSNDDVVGFVKNLEQSGVFKWVFLEGVTASTESKVRVFRFSLSLGLNTK